MLAGEAERVGGGMLRVLLVLLGAGAGLKEAADPKLGCVAVLLGSYTAHPCTPCLYLALVERKDWARIGYVRGGGPAVQ